MCRYMDTPAEFSLMVITANKQTGEGGEELFIPRAWKNSSLTPKEQQALDKAQEIEVVFRRNPNHYENSTRNLRLPNTEIRKIHIRLVRQFNGKTVL